MFDKLLGQFRSTLIDFKETTIGKTASGKPLVLFTRDVPGKNVLVCSGIHGNEIAGPLGLLLYAQNYLKEAQVNVQFLPLINPSGINRGTRSNPRGQNIDSGFNTRLSEEGHILFNYFSGKTYDALLSLHEDDVRSPYAFTYSFEHGAIDAFKTACIVTTLGEYFPIHPDGHLKHVTSDPNISVTSGNIRNYSDSSFEEYMFRSGTRYTVCTETDKNAAIDKRVSACCMVVKCFIDII
jgi:predicted deacylase